jgi:LmbE family N-acetylglucosaminyl deacetylase
VLCLGAHPDDIEIGCGGTILSLLASRKVDCRWVVFSGAGTPREAEARRSAELFLGRGAGIEVHGFRDGFFPYLGGQVKDAFEALTKTLDPDLIFTHARADRHQDHRIVSDLTWNTFRSHLILEYEIPKYDGDLGIPNLFAPITEAVARKKLRLLSTAFPTQRRKRWFSADTFRAVLRLRGIESGAPEGLAEAFYARKAVVTWK